MASTFNVRYPAGGPEYHIGFTVIMHVKDKDGNPLIDVQLPYVAGQYTYLPRSGLAMPSSLWRYIIFGKDGSICYF
ncbi:MAG: hypothetical protein IPG39_21015 [Bacteroidetes bacterium]|nr:hypothetical protein [Bacteroidota bacterium]